MPTDSWLRHYAGDALWAMAVLWSLAILRPSTQTRHLLPLTLAIALAIELSQLYHADWIDAIRALKPAALILGHTFLWTDLISYAVGAATAALLHARFIYKSPSSANIKASLPTPRG